MHTPLSSGYLPFFSLSLGDEASLFNPDCSLVQLVTDIRKRCPCLSPEVGVALATDKLAIVHLSPEDSLENASSLFVNRTSYTLLAVHRKSLKMHTLQHCHWMRKGSSYDSDPFVHVALPCMEMMLFLHVHKRKFHTQIIYDICASTHCINTMHYVHLHPHSPRQGR